MRAWFLPTLPRVKEGSCLAPLTEAEGAFYHGSLCSVTVPTRKGPGTVCGSSWSSGEVLDRVADLHTSPVEGPAQTQHSQQDDKCPGCIDASVSPSVLPCAKLVKKGDGVTVDLSPLSKSPSNRHTERELQCLFPYPCVSTFRDLKGPVVLYSPREVHNLYNPRHLSVFLSVGQGSQVS